MVNAGGGWSAGGRGDVAFGQIIKMRRQDKNERDARQAVVDEYLAALGDYGSTPLAMAPTRPRAAA